MTWKITSMDKQKLLDYIKYRDDESCFELAQEYHKKEQYAAAISFYMKCCEKTEDKNLAYECMLKISLCFMRQGRREFSTKCLLQQAIWHSPTRPEAYFLLSRLMEWQRQWFESYNYATIGIAIWDKSVAPLRTWVEYPGAYGLLFQKAISSWWCGKTDECRKLFQEIIINHGNDLDEAHGRAVQYSVTRIGLRKEDAFNPYDKSKQPALKFKFTGSENIEQNYSQCYQDMFILTMLNGKRNGKYFEVGAADPYYGSNTALLEKEFGWTGHSLEILDHEVAKFREHRSNPVHHVDATKINYRTFLRSLNMGNDFDYLQLDCEPPSTTFEILLGIPFDEFRFAVITFEHDYYTDITRSYRDKSRKYLLSQGYELVAADIAPNDWASFEDWWVHPDLVDRETIDRMKSVTGQPQHCEKYLINV